MKSGVSSLHVALRKGRRAWSLLASGKIDFLLCKSLHAMGVKGVIDRYPLTLMIEPTNACNLNCPLCPTGSGALKRPKRMMTFAEFTRIIDQIKGHAERINLYGLGEPFLHPEILPMIRYASGAGIGVLVSTNGTMFGSKAFCGETVRSGLAHLMVCLDGPNQETLDQYRKNADFAGVIEGIRNVMEARKQGGGKAPVIELQFIVMKHNEHLKNAMRALAQELGVDVYSEKTATLFLLPGEKGFQEKALSFLPRDLSDSRYNESADGRISMKGGPGGDCPWLYQSTCINADGTVVPCCFDWHAQYVMGNVFQESLQSIWRGKKYRAFRKCIARSRQSVPMCAHCPQNRNGVTMKEKFSIIRRGRGKAQSSC